TVPDVASSVSTGPMTCDQTPGCFASQDLPGCINCANMNECAVEAKICFTANPDCAALMNCLEMCNNDQACANGCINQYPNGTQDLENWGNCICSVGCPTACASQCGG